MALLACRSKVRSNRLHDHRLTDKSHDVLLKKELEPWQTVTASPIPTEATVSAWKLAVSIAQVFVSVPGWIRVKTQLTIREGIDPLNVRKLPGLIKYSNIVLKWGISDDSELWDWRKEATDGKVARKSGSIVLLDDWGRKRCVGTLSQGGPPSGLGRASTPPATRLPSRRWKSCMKD